MRAVVSLSVCVALLLTAPAARANGDPASHVLLPLDAYIPLSAAHTRAAADLTTATETVYRRGYRIKVAVVAARDDLGTIPQYFGRPDQYAKLLGKEIASYYVGPVLIVMKAGFGLYDGGRPVKFERQALLKLKPRGTSGRDLTASAALAVTTLMRANALRSKDILPPSPLLQFSFITAAKPVKLRYRILEDSKWASDTVTVYAGTKRLAIFTHVLRRVVFATEQGVSWTPPTPLPAEQVRFCVLTRDKAGNHSTACLPLRPPEP